MRASTMPMSNAIHEKPPRDEMIEPGSDRLFGAVMAAALAIFGVIDGWHAGRFWPWLFTLAALLGLLAMLRPALLHQLNRWWTELGLLMHRVVSPVVMGLVFYGTILPAGLVFRMRGRDLLRLNRDPQAETYWLRRPQGPLPETMKDQF